jgi:glycosyltransferase involved in cell wall biosynthesis
METAIREGICPPDRIHYLGNGIDLDQFDPDLVPPDKVMALRAELGIPPQRPVIGFVARLVQEKGIYELIEAASILKSKAIQARFLVIGTAQKGRKGTVSPEGVIHELGVEKEVMLLGYRDDIPELLSLMDMVVLPSYGREGVPRILMESAALGKPVVATRVRGNVEAVEDGKTGVLVPVRDGPALADAILGLLNAPDRAAEMGRQARQRALTHFDERHFFWRTDQEYRRLLKDRLKLDPSSLLEPVPSR